MLLTACKVMTSMGAVCRLTKPVFDIGRVSYTEHEEPSGHVQRSYHLHVGRSDQIGQGNLADDRWEREKPHHGYPVQGRKWATQPFELEREEP